MFSMTKSTEPLQKDDPHRHTDAGKTTVQQNGDSAPKLPHERDQSSESQQTADDAPTEVGRQALADLKRGMEDTDRGPETDRLYNEKIKP